MDKTNREKRGKFMLAVATAIVFTACAIWLVGMFTVKAEDGGDPVLAHLEESYRLDGEGALIILESRKNTEIAICNRKLEKHYAGEELLGHEDKTRCEGKVEGIGLEYNLF